MNNSPLVLWDVDGTLSDSLQLGFDSTNAVLQRNGKNPISTESYHQGTKFTTPRRMAWHVTGDPDHLIGEELVYVGLQQY
jgi:phosphoglycolate phosphatase-like HAD superfamily hydrolase